MHLIEMVIVWILPPVLILGLGFIIVGLVVRKGW